MSEIIISDYALKCAAAEYREAVLAALPTPEEIPDHEFSAEYVAKREKLIRRAELRKSARRWAKNAAALFLVCFLSAGAFLGINSEAHADFLAWARGIYEKSIIYRFVGEESAAPLPVCELTWVPEGYELMDSFRDENSFALVYENEYGDAFIFSCDRMTEYSLMQLIPTGEGYSEKVWVNGMSGEMFIATDGSMDNELVWYEENSNFIYVLNCSNLDIPVILHIAKNINIAK